jgi:hypothetical protein
MGGEGEGGVRARRWGGPLALALLCAAFYAPALDAGRQFLFRDSGRMHWPVKRWMAEELSRGHLPEWNPYAAAGVPVVAGGVDAALHPLNLLLVALPFDAAFKAWVILSALGAGLGAFLWARRLGAERPAAVLSGAAFMLSGFLVSSTDNVQYLTAAAAFPWMLAAGHAFAVAGGPGRLAGVALASFACAAAGDPMGWGVALALAVAQAVLVAPAGRARGERALALGVASVLGAAPALLPVLLWIPHSSRGAPLSARDLAAWNLPPVRALELLVPHLTLGPLGDVYDAAYEAIAPSDPARRPWVISVYVGAPVLTLAAVAVRERIGRALVAGAALLTWAAMGPYAGFGAVAARLPVLARLRYWEKLAVWPALLLGAAAALGGCAILARPRTALRAAVGSAVAAALLLIVAEVAVLAPDAVGGALGPGARGAGVRAMLAENVRAGSVHAALALAALAAVSAAAWRLQGERVRRAIPVAMAALVAVDLAIAHRDAWVLSPMTVVDSASPIAAAARAASPWPRLVNFVQAPEHAYPGLTIFESQWRVGHQILTAPWNVPERIGNYDAYTGMVPVELLQAIASLDRFAQRQAFSNWSFSLAVTPARQDALNRVGLAAPLDVVGGDPELDAWLVRIPHRPRAWIGRGIAVEGPHAALAFAGAEPVGSGRAAVKGPVPPVQAPGGSARILEDAGERVEVDAVVWGEGTALLVLSDQLAPGWTAELDGSPAEIVRANYLARGVWVPAGRHRVVFRYRTPGLWEGVALAAALAAALGADALRRRRALALTAS